MSYTLPDPGPPNLEFERPADRARLEQAVQALEGRGFKALIADSGAHARELVLAALPDGAEVHTALSETLAELGITAEIEESGRYDSVRQKLKGLDRETQGREMRKLGAAPDYEVGSVHAVTDDGRLVVALGLGQPTRRVRLCRRPGHPRRRPPEARARPRGRPPPRPRVLPPARVRAHAGRSATRAPCSRRRC